MSAYEFVIASREHWERMRDNPFGCGETPSASFCALCTQYQGVDDCGDCPIKEYTGKDMCHDTPYVKAAAIWRTMSLLLSLDKEWLAAAQAEIDFLNKIAEWVKQKAGEST